MNLDCICVILSDSNKVGSITLMHLNLVCWTIEHGCELNTILIIPF